MCIKKYIRLSTILKILSFHSFKALHSTLPFTPSITKIIQCRCNNSSAGCPIWPKFKLIQDNMHGLVACKFKEERIISNREKVETPFPQLQIYGNYSRRSRAVNSGVDLSRDFMVILVTCKNKGDPNKNKGAGVTQHFPHYTSII